MPAQHPFDYNREYYAEYGPLLTGAVIEKADVLTIPDLGEGTEDWPLLVLRQGTALLWMAAQQDTEGNGPGALLIGGRHRASETYAPCDFPADLIGRRVTQAHALPPALCKTLGWFTNPMRPPPLQLVLDDGRWITCARPDQSDEGGFWTPDLDPDWFDGALAGARLRVAEVLTPDTAARAGIRPRAESPAPARVILEGDGWEGWLAPTGEWGEGYGQWTVWASEATTYTAPGAALARLLPGDQTVSGTVLMHTRPTTIVGLRDQGNTLAIGSIMQRTGTALIGIKLADGRVLIATQRAADGAVAPAAMRGRITIAGGTLPLQLDPPGAD